jgi:hypothetical protein
MGRAVMIESIEFGKITIQGQTYTTDVRIMPDGRILDQWWRKHGHRLTLEDLDVLLAAKPQALVVGAGVYGRMLPEAGLEETIQAMGIDLFIAPNDQAMREFNRTVASRAAAGCFHLTC